MTYKYMHVRRAFFEANLTEKYKKNRKLSDMVHLFKPLYWIMFLVFIASSIGFIVLFLIKFQNPLIWIPAIIIITISLLSQIIREKHFYNNNYRLIELIQIMNDYDNFITDVCQIFQEYKIDTREKLSILKNECVTTINLNDEKYKQINNRIFDMLIGIPIGALIASIIYSNNSVTPAVIGALVIIGLIIMTIVKLVKIFNYYSEGYFKDKYLLDIINEVYYQDKFIN